jgi:hypothetical protein
LVFFLTEEYRMQLRKFLLAAATIAAISPIVCYASPEKTALNACANALASSVATAGSDAPGYQLKYQHSQADPLVDYYGRQYTFYLQARDAKTGMPLGRVTCSADRHGTVIAWTPVPLGAPEPALAARF